MKTLLKYSVTILATTVANVGMCANILVNSGFEDGLNGWTPTFGSATYISDSTIYHSGSASVLGQETSSGSLGALFQDITGDIVVGEEYVLSGWIRTQDVIGGGGAGIGISYVDASGYTPANGHIVGVSLLSGTNDWTYIESAPFVIPEMPTGVTALHFSLDFADASGSAWFDDLALNGAAAVVPLPSALLLFGSGLVGLLGIKLRRGGVACSSV